MRIKRYNTLDERSYRERYSHLKLLVDKKMKNLIFLKRYFVPFFTIAIGLILMINLTGCNSTNNKMNKGQAEKAKIDTLISKMTLQEKIGMLHGNSFFTSAGVKKLGIPEMHYSDGPFGVREEVHANSWTPLGLPTDSATYLPTGSALAATWDTSLAHKYGMVLGQEARARGKDMILGPAVNIDRNPNGGRTFEFLTEDPYLNAQLTTAYIEGVQSQGVASCVKHFVANNQETNRRDVDEVIGERALREIYLPAFKAAVQKAHVDAVMAAYNKVNGNYCSANKNLLNSILEKEWGFKGMVISDWGGVHSTIKAADAGLDVEMGTGTEYNQFYFADPLLDSVQTGKVSERVINNKVRRILRVMYRLHMIGGGTRPNGTINTPEHHKIAYDVASESIVLLKNSKQLLPLDASKMKSIAVIGANAVIKQAHLGFGAGVKAQYEITPLAGIKKLLKGKVAVHYSPGYKEAYEKIKEPGPKRIPVDKPIQKLIRDAVKVAKSSDAAIVMAGNTRTYETEGADRNSLALPFGENELIRAVTAVNPNTVVVIISGAPVELGQVLNETSALIWSGYNGSEGGHALADVLFGNIDPSGRLPFTFPKSLKDTPSFKLGSFPGKDDTTHYEEGILVGYRWYDTKHIQPLFPFGYGLSYTHFDFSDIKTDKTDYTQNEDIKLSLNLKNTGAYQGKETVQVYVHVVNPSVMMADKELKAFKKVSLNPGEEKNVQFSIPVKDLAYFDVDKNKWVVLPGKYQIMVGASSRDIRGRAGITIQ